MFSHLTLATLSCSTRCKAKQPIVSFENHRTIEIHRQQAALEQISNSVALNVASFYAKTLFAFKARSFMFFLPVACLPFCVAGPRHDTPNNAPYYAPCISSPALYYGKFANFMFFFSFFA